jgi:ethanolamine utilization protein EutA
MNVDVGGGTSKIALCADGKVVAVTALDVGARLVCLDATGRITRIEEAGRCFAAELGVNAEPGSTLTQQDARALAQLMADRLFEAMRGGAPSVGGAKLLRLNPLPHRGEITEVTFSGGVAEYIYGREAKTFGDLGGWLAGEIRRRVENWGPRLEKPSEGIRATVIGASQYTTQVSGSTIFVAPLEALPLRNVAVIAPDFSALGDDTIDSSLIASAITATLGRLDLAHGRDPVAVFVPWQGSATFHRLDALCRGLVEGLGQILARGHPLVLAGDGDVGGLIGIHLREEMRLKNPIVSVDGLELKEFDYIDIGTMLESSGAVPVVIKSLIFPSSTAVGQDWQAERLEVTSP